MGIYDREYVRMGPRSRSGLGKIQFISFNSWIIILNIAVFVVDPMLSRWMRPVPVDERVLPDYASVPARDRVIAVPQQIAPVGGTVEAPVMNQKTGEVIGRAKLMTMTPLQEHGHFSTARGFVPGMQVWRLITFQFLHANLMHLVLNMFGLWVFGGMVEQYLGFKRYAAFYLICGIAGGVSYLALNFLGSMIGLKLPGVLVDSPLTPLVGASAGVFGVIMACAFIAPNAIVLVYLLPLRLKVMAYGYVLIAAFNLLRGGTNAGGDAAHIGGAIAGFFFIRNAHLLRDFFDVLGNSRKSPAKEVEPEIDTAEVNRILDKATTQGLSTLSPEEKAILRRTAGKRVKGEGAGT
jgi:membrane associated rhomboid family serine protease